MSEATRKKIIFATLPLAIVWALFNLPGKKNSPAVETPVAAVPTPAAPQPTVAEPGQINIEEHQSQPWGRDPFRTYAYRAEFSPAETGSLEWKLAGIIFNPSNPLAFINRKSVRVGDTIGGATVVAITKKTVVLDHRGQQITLSLDKG